jgi:hypothetical protein
VATTAEMTAGAALAETRAGTRAEIGTEVATGAVTEDVRDRVTETGAQSIPSHPIPSICNLIATQGEKRGGDYCGFRSR